MLSTWTIRQLSQLLSNFMEYNIEMYMKLNSQTRSMQSMSNVIYIHVQMYISFQSLNSMHSVKLTLYLFNCSYTVRYHAIHSL